MSKRDLICLQTKHVVVIGGLPLTSSVGRKWRGCTVPKANIEEALKADEKIPKKTTKGPTGGALLSFPFTWKVRDLG